MQIQLVSTAVSVYIGFSFVFSDDDGAFFKGNIPSLNPNSFHLQPTLCLLFLFKVSRKKKKKTNNNLKIPFFFICSKRLNRKDKLFILLLN
jgi:hypothetical protein